MLSIDVELGKVRASVQGSRPKPYAVQIGVKVLSRKQWDHLLEVRLTEGVVGTERATAELLRWAEAEGISPPGASAGS